MVTLNWELFKNTYVRPLLNDVLDESYTDDTLEATAYTTIVDMTAKGIPNLTPQPSSSLVAGVSQINYLDISSAIVEGNIFYVFIDDQSESYTAVTNDTLAEVLTGLTDAINNSVQSSFANITATNQTLRIKVEGAVSTSFIIDASTAQGQGNTNNPTIALTLGREATDAEQVTTPITSLGADLNTAFSVLAYGIRYFLTADPITRLSTTAGLQVTKDEDLVEVARADYYNGILAYLEANNISNAAADYWRSRLVTNLDLSTNGGLTYEQQLALMNAEYDRRIEQDDNKIGDTGNQQRLTEDAKLRHRIALRELERQYQLDDERDLSDQRATNGAWTIGGQFSQTFVSDYYVALEDTVNVNLYNLTNSYFELDNDVDATQTLESIVIEVDNYKRFDISIQSDNAVEFKFYASVDDVTYLQVGNSTISTQIEKAYALPPSKYIKFEVIGITNNTNFFVNATLYIDN
jgi:hypothetical protein